MGPNCPIARATTAERELARRGGAEAASRVNDLRASERRLAKLANATRVAATVRAFESSMDGGSQGAVRARDYATVAKTMSEMIVDLGSPDLELQKELQQLALATDDAGVPHIGELEGTHTVDLEPPQLIEAKGEVKS